METTGFPGGSVVKRPSTSAGDAGEPDLPWVRKIAAHSSILAWGIPWTEPDRLQSIGP